MLTKTELLDEIESMVDLIEAARIALQDNRMVDLSQVQERVRAATVGVQLLPAADAQEVRPHLVTLVKEMQSFSVELQTRIDALGDEEEPSAGER